MTNKEFIESIRLEGEEWRDVIGWEGYYMVSSFGRIASVAREITKKNGSKYPVNGKLLKPTASKHNGIYYYYTCLRKNDIRLIKGVHRLVAESFLPNPNNYTDVDHIDRNSLNNNLQNLRWCSRKMNMNNENTLIVVAASRLGKRMPSLHKPVVQLKDGVVINTYCSITEAAKATGLSVGGIVTVCKGRRPLYNGFGFAYATQDKTLINQ